MFQTSEFERPIIVKTNLREKRTKAKTERMNTESESC